MNVLRKIRRRLGNIPILHRTYRAATGKSGPRWHLIIRFNARNKSWSCQSFPCYQSRAISSIHLIAEAMEGARMQLRRSFKVVAWLGDNPPEWLFLERHLAYAKSSEDHNTILIPDFVFWAWPEAGIVDYVQMAAQMIDASRCTHSKRGLFWIGGDHHHPTRKLLFDLAQHDRRIIAQSVEFIGNKADAPRHLLPTKNKNFVSLPSHCDYQYLIDLQGAGYSARLKLLLFSGRPLFIQQRRPHEYFFDRLEPFKHYIPVSEDLSDLSAMLDWADSHPTEAASIARTAQEFAKENLMREHAVAEFKRIFLQLSNGAEST